jgi:hypothetical protein
LSPRSNPANDANRLARVALLAALAWVIASFLVQELYSLDAWWHIAIGRDILDHWSIPRVDRYTALGLGLPYHDSHWLFQLLLGAFHRAFGLVGAQWVQIGLWGGALTLVYRAARRWTETGTSAALTFLAAMACVERFLPRPEAVTVLMVAAFYLILADRDRSLRARIAILVVLQVIWVNSHGLFVIGPGMVGAYAVEAVWIRWRAKSGEWKPALATLGAVLLATLVTPYGVGAWAYAALILTEASAPGTVSTLGEMSSTFGATARSSPVFWFFAALLVLVVGATSHALARQRPISLARSFIVLAMLLAALMGRRNIVLFAVVAAPFLAETLAPVLDSFGRRSVTRIALALAMLAWSWMPLSGRFYLNLELPTRFGFGATPSFFPHGLPNFLEQIDFQGNVLNSNTLGGFLTYHRYPQNLPLTDGRWEIYGSKRIESVITATRTPGVWRNTVRAHDLRGVLLAHTSPEAEALLPDLAQDPSWRLVYVDHAASFWMSSTTPEAPTARDPREALSSLPSRFDDAVILAAFYDGIGAHALQVEALERALEFNWRSQMLLEQLGPLQLDLEDYAGAEQTYRGLIALDPQNASALNELAFLAYVRSDLDEALSLMRKAFALDADNPQYRQNLDRLRAAFDAATGEEPAQ